MPAITFEQALKGNPYPDQTPPAFVNKSAQGDDSFTIQKADEDKRLVFGWASIAITVDGEQLEDRQKDIIDPEDLEEAAYEYVLNFRDTGEEHIPSMRKKGKLVESCVLTAEKQKAMGIPEGTLPIGWWIGFKIEDDAAWERVKNGTYKMFSIEGKASRIPVEKSERVAKTFDEILKANPYHDSLGRFTSAPGGGSSTPKMSAATAIGEYQDYAYQAINDGLRSGKLEGKAKEISDALDDAFNNAKPTKWSQTVHRADGAATTAEIWEKTNLAEKLPRKGSMTDVWMDADARNAITQAMVGQTFTDKGFMSTSKSWEKAEEFASGNRYNPHGVEAIVHINVPKGTRVLDLGSDGFISGSGEEETILNRGSSYKITAVTMNHRIGGLDIYADLLTDTAKSTSVAKTFDEIMKFNPYHDSRGRFASANSASSFTYAPGKSKAHDLAIQRAQERKATAASTCRAINASDAKQMKQAMGQDLDPWSDYDAMMMMSDETGYFESTGSFAINKKIRKGEALSPEEQKTVDTIEKYMAPLPEGIKVTRMANSDFMQSIAKKQYDDLQTCKPQDEDKVFETLKKTITGGTVTETAYVSTSYDESKNVFMDRAVKIEMNVPKGTKALFSPSDREAELLLPKNTSYRIDDVINRGYGDITMKVTVVS